MLSGISILPVGEPVTTESGGTAQFAVHLEDDVPFLTAVNVGLTSADTSEGTVNPTSLTFYWIDWSHDQIITVTGVDDWVSDGGVDYQINAKGTDFMSQRKGSITVTNLDNDTAGIMVTPSSDLVTTEAGGQATFTIQLDSEPTAPVTIDLSSSDITEGIASPESVIFEPENWNTAQTVTITGVDDDVDDDSVGYVIETAAAVSADTNYAGLAAPDVPVVNRDDDTAGIAVSPTSDLETTEAGDNATFTIRIDSEPTAPVTISLNSSDTAEGTVLPASITFEPQNWNAPQTVTVLGVDDDLIDGNVGYTIETSATISIDPKYNGLDVPDVAVINRDNDLEASARHVFYDNSAFDTGDGKTDDDAIATDKMALLPGETATAANYTNYSRGINGVMVDIAGLADPDSLGVDDFQFRVGNIDDPQSWQQTAPPTEIDVRADAGVGGSDRVSLIWQEGAVTNGWLEVTMLATDNTGLTEPDVFYFANMTGDADSSGVADLSDFDLWSATKFMQVGLDAAADFDRSGAVDLSDFNIWNAHKFTGIATAANPVPPNVAEEEPQDPTGAINELAWLRELEQSRSQRSSDASTLAARAVDRLLATY